MIGEEHDSDGNTIDEGDADEALDVHAAADIWLSSGMDEGYTLGYSESELRLASEEG
jgi:hypothetical protein